MSSKPAIEVNPVKKENLPEKIIREIKHLIHSGQIAPGSRLPGERNLANMLSASRSSLGEALKALRILGVIENRHGDGNFISASPND
jgi:DNA-binding FadR family transcriptional regulator